MDIKQYTFINSKEKSQKGTKNAENGMKQNKAPKDL